MKKNEPNLSTPKPRSKTSAERKQAERKRKAEAGLAEVRGIYATPPQSLRIKAYAKRLIKSDAASC